MCKLNKYLDYNQALKQLSGNASVSDAGFLRCILGIAQTHP
jgi:hypothetical protein